jgi:tetratricopeptide (TPR) repeat protein
MAHYYSDNGQLDKGITAYELYGQTYPRDSTPFSNLASIYNQLGQFDNALEKAKRAVEVDPDSVTGYQNLAWAYEGLNRVEEARATFNAALQRKLDPMQFHLGLAGCDWAEGRDADMEKELQLAAGTPEGDMTVFAFRAGLATARGQFQKARDFTRQTADIFERLHLQGRASLESSLAGSEALVGNRSEAMAEVNEALQSPHTFNILWNSGMALAIMREDQKAIAVADELQRTHPNDTTAVNVAAPMIRAIAALRPANPAKADPAKAIDLINGAALYARGSTGVFFTRGLAFELLGRYPEARQDLQKVIDLKARSGPDPVYEVAQLELGRLSQKEGDAPKARIAYQNFLADWKDADPDLPLLKEVKAEYARLQ